MNIEAFLAEHPWLGSIVSIGILIVMYVCRRKQSRKDSRILDIKEDKSMNQELVCTFKEGVQNKLSALAQEESVLIKQLKNIKLRKFVLGAVDKFEFTEDADLAQVEDFLNNIETLFSFTKSEEITTQINEGGEING